MSATICKLCSVNDSDEAKGDGSDEMFSRDYHIHYDCGVFRQECDEWVEEENEEEKIDEQVFRLEN